MSKGTPHKKIRVRLEKIELHVKYRGPISDNDTSNARKSPDRIRQFGTHIRNQQTELYHLVEKLIENGLH